MPKDDLPKTLRDRSNRWSRLVGSVEKVHAWRRDMPPERRQELAHYLSMIRQTERRGGIVPRVSLTRWLRPSQKQQRGEFLMELRQAEREGKEHPETPQRKLMTWQRQLLADYLRELRQAMREVRIAPRVTLQRNVVRNSESE